MHENNMDKRQYYNFLKHKHTFCQTKVESKFITITAERLSDHSHITFTISSNKRIEQLRALLNHHLPPLLPNNFDLYSYQRGALIHFHPSSFRLDYFPVIFDQSVLLLKMDDRFDDENYRTSFLVDRNKLRNISKKSKYFSLSKFFRSKSSIPIMKNSTVESTSTTNVKCCLPLLKQLFHKSSSNSVNATRKTNVISY